MTELKTFSDIKKALTEKGFRIVNSGDCYLTVQSWDGVQAYFQMNTYGYRTDISSCHAEGFTFSTKHKPNKESGSGWRTFAIDPTRDVEKIELYLFRTLEQSRRNIAIGIEKPVIT